jgi:hypothetical protein
MRDHGGYLQGNELSTMSHKQLMDSAKQSFLADINSSFDILQIDSSKIKDRQQLVETTLELIDFCESECPNDMVYQVNVESHSPKFHTEQNKEDLTEILTRSKAKDRIKFVSGNTGLCVYEDKNTGVINDETMSNLIWFTDSQKKFFIQHNCDYLNSSQMMHLRYLGAPIVNVAPEFGSIETKAIINFLHDNNLEKELDSLMNLAVKSGKWKKWFDRGDQKVSDMEILRVCGHYIFDDPFVKQLKLTYPEINGKIEKTLESTIMCQLGWLGW